jgi:hypothetical protein
MENLYSPDCIRTFTGKYINPLNPDPDQICIEDIAHALSMMPRFGGHLPVFYSVAEHCIRVAEHLPDNFKLEGLLHDASEAYLIDVPRPIKYNLGGYREYENALMLMIATAFGFSWPLPKEVKEADESLLRREWDGLMLGKSLATYRTMSPMHAKNAFLLLFNRLMGR